MAVESFTERVRRARREKGGEQWTTEDEREWLAAHPEDTPLPGYDVTPEPEPIQHDPDLIPDIDPYEGSEEDDEVDAIVARIGIVEAYNRWANKGTAEPRGRTESIKVRCPNPSHADHNPSAWLNTDKEVWVCAGCGFEGGDKFDIAAWGLGFPVPGYKDGKKFPELRRAMAADLGYTVRRNKSTGKDRATRVAPEPGVAAVAVAPASTDDDASPTPEPEDDAKPTASVTPLHPMIDPDSTLNTSLKLDWRDIVKEDTFLDSWMKETTLDDLPEEYHFWTGMMALGLAVGNDIHLSDYQPVYGNLFATIIGDTGIGKSRSVRNITNIMRDVMPYDRSDATNTGVAIVKGVGSGEALIDNFVETHPNDVGDGEYTVPVRGLMQFDELASLVGKSAHTGSILKPVLMEFYDKNPVISAKSRGHGEVEAIEPFGSCITTTQPNSLRNLVDRADADSGFLNRWIFVWGTRKESVSYGGVLVTLDESARQLRAIRTWAAMRRPGVMSLEGDALALWDKFFKDNIDPITATKSGGDTGSGDPLIARLSLTFKKLILLMAINAREVNPSVDSVRRALDLWGYIKSSYRMVGVRITSSEQTDIEDRIIEFITHTTGGKGAGRKRIVDALKSSFEREDIRRAIKTLEELGIIEEVTLARSGKRGPAPIVLRMVD